MPTAPHLCRPIEFLFPAYRGETPAPADAGRRHRAVQRAGARGAPPVAQPHADRRRALRAGAAAAHGRPRRRASLYVDCQTDDARLVLENVLDAEAAGAAVANHLRAETPLRDRRGRVTRRSRSRTARAARRFDSPRPRRGQRAPGRSPTLLAERRAAACARPWACTWCSMPRACPHGGRALVLRSPRDDRLFFVLPAGARTIVGTTDTDWTPPASRPPRPDDDIRARGDDVAYLLEAANHAFPPARWRPDDVLSTFAGLRPLLASERRTRPRRPRASTRSCVDRDGVLDDRGRQADDPARAWAKRPSTRSIEAAARPRLERPLDRCVDRRSPAAGRRPTPASLAQHESAARRDGPPGRTPTAAAPELVACARRRLAGAGARASIPSFRTSGPRSFTRSATSTRARSRTCCGGACRCSATPRDQGLAAAEGVATILGRRAGVAAGAPRAPRCSPTQRRRALPPLARRSRRSQDRDHAVDRAQPRVERQHRLRARARDIAGGD